MAAISTNAAEKKAPKGSFKSPWSLHIRSFWKTLFINPPEVQRHVVRLLIYERNIDDDKVSKSSISVNGKVAEYTPISATGRNSRYKTYIQTSITKRYTKFIKFAT
jgi:hypothetical protein